MITKQQAIDSHHGQVFHHVSIKNADGTPVRCRVNGRCQVWKTRPDDFRLPVKHGLRGYFSIGPHNSDEWELP